VHSGTTEERVVRGGGAAVLWEGGRGCGKERWVVGKGFSRRLSLPLISTLCLPNLWTKQKSWLDHIFSNGENQILFKN